MRADFKNIKFVLMDIEGTTSNIAFVKEVLFPYSARELRNFVSQKRTNPTVRDCLKQTGATDDNGAIEQLLTWIKDDVKHPALKTLQGMIWKKGYEEGAYKAHLYPEVVECWRAWKAKGLRLGIYSSGSVPAQKLLFAFSEQGDVTSFLEAYFDLQMGGKRESASYQKIATELDIPPGNILFLSDIVEELNAARQAGYQTAHVVRPGTASAPGHPEIQSFTDIKI